MEQRSDVELLRAIRESFIASRTEQEGMVKRWADEISKLPIDVQEELGIPDDLSLKALIPEFYKEAPDQEQYEKEYEAAQSFFRRLNSIADEKNKEARKCLSEFEAMNSKR